MPKNQRFVRYIVDRFETVTVILLLPLFFAFTGLRTTIGLLKGHDMWMYCGLIVLVATVGKLGGSMLASRVAGMSLRDAAKLGALMNTRGLMELVILNIGLDIKVLSPTLFCMMVIMALFTTFITTPILDMLDSGKQSPRLAKDVQETPLPIAV
jgi:K+:H+ antiporter